MIPSEGEQWGRYNLPRSDGVRGKKSSPHVPLYTTCARPQLSQGRMLMVGSRAAWTSSLLATMPDTLGVETLGSFGGKTHGKTQRNMWEYGKNCGILVGVWTSMFMWEYGKNCGIFVGGWTSMFMWEYGKTHGKTKKETSVNRPSETKSQSRKNTLQVMKKNWHLSGK